MIPAEFPANYIDPGTAGVVFTSLGTVITGILAAAAAFLGTYFFRPLKRLLRRIHEKLRERKVKLMFLGGIITIAFIGAFISFSGDFAVAGKTKVLVLGIDALDARVVEKLMDEGKMPNFRKLKADGGYSRLLSTIPPETPVAWTAAATGTNPGGYGIYDFIGRDPKTYTPKLLLTEMKSGLTGVSYSSGNKGTPFWEITSERGFPTTVIKWPVTFPAEKVNGRMLSGLGTVDIRGYLNSYSYYTTEHMEKKPDNVGRVVAVTENNGRISTSVYGPRVMGAGGTRDAQVPMGISLYSDHAVIDVEGQEHSVDVNGWSDWISADFKVDFMRSAKGLFKVYLISTNPFRMYMTSVQIHPESPVFDISYPKDYARKLADDIGLYYTMGLPEDTKALTEGRITEEIFRQQVNEIEEERTRMFWHEFDRFDSGVLAFGFDSGDRLQHIFFTGFDDIPQVLQDYYMEKDALLGKIIDRIDKDTKLIIFSDHGFNVFKRAVNINTWLVQNGYMTLTNETTDRDPGELFRYVDWNRTKAYSVGFSSIFINLKGREGHGIVPEDEKSVLMDEIKRKLEQLKDPKTGKRAVVEVYRGDEIYSGPQTGTAPDLVVGFGEGYRMSWQSAVGGVTPELITDNTGEWRADHLMNRSYVPAVVFANFKIRKKNPEMPDIAPTVLKLLDIPVPEYMDGRSLV